MRIRAFIFKKWFIYIGWLIVHRPQEPFLYAANAKTVIIHTEHTLPYATFGFTAKKVKRKLSRYIERHGDKYLEDGEDERK